VSGGLPGLLRFAAMAREWFDAPWDTGLKAITAGVLVVLAAAPVAAFVVLLVPVLLVLYFGGHREAPRGFTVGPAEVSIERRGGPVVRLFATRASGRVILATDNGPVVVTPGAPESFVAGVRRRLGSPG
jgi:hypothetical protein